MFAILPILFVIGFLLFFGFFVVKQKSVAIIQRFGKHNHISTPGLNWKIPLVDKLVARLEMRILQMIVKVESKTLDNVFVHLDVAVQYQISDPHKAFYELSDPQGQIESFVFDVVRAQVPKLTIDQVFEAKDDIAVAVKKELSDAMDDFGYRIIKSLVTDIDPDSKVKHSMNEINATERMKIAAENEADAEKIRVVKGAEAQAASKRLQGEGIAQQRMAIANGLRESTQLIKESLGKASEEDVMKILLLTQHYDTMEAMSKHGNNKVIFVDQSPSSLGKISQQITEGIILGNQVE